MVSKSSRNVRVETDEGVLLCSLRGKIRDARSKRMPVVVGDRVVISRTAPDEAVLEKVLPRRNALSRSRAPSGREPSWSTGRRGRRDPNETVIAANVDQVLLVLAAVAPPPRWSLVDRVLVSAEYEGVAAGICLNKCDQVDDDAEERAELESWLALYRDLGYAAFAVSALARRGIDALEGWLRDRFTVLSGHSGVGKSTLLNTLVPALTVETGAVNRTTGKGRHTTTAVTLYALDEGGHLVDTPGYREYGLLGLGAADVGRFYVEFRPHVGHCRFTDCLHVEEPECAVRTALERELIDARRYENYLQILASF